MTSEEYKKLSLLEFDHMAEKFDDSDPSIYNMCRKDYPDVVAEVVKEPFSDLLDAGCGTGAMLEMFKRDYPDKRYTGVYLSEKGEYDGFTIRRCSGNSTDSPCGQGK